MLCQQLRTVAHEERADAMKQAAARKRQLAAWLSIRFILGGCAMS